MSNYPTLEAEVEPEAVGLSSLRLVRIQAHLERLVDAGQLPGYLVVVTRRGKVAYVASGGMADVARHTPTRADSLFRIYSMTKPVTTVAAMMLYEQGLFRLSTEVSEFIPSFADVRVFDGGTADAARSVPAKEPVRMGHLLTHTSGLSYGWYHVNQVDEMYRRAGYELSSPSGKSLADACDDWAGIPLQFEPGSGWHYSVATDVVGRVVEVITGQKLAEFFDEHIFGPLRMTETGFGLDPAERHRLGRLYVADGETFHPDDELGAVPLGGDRLFGGGGLISSAHDYHRFSQMLLHEGELDGVRLLGDRTLSYMRCNHLPGDVDIPTYSGVRCDEGDLPGVGFGLGFSVVIDPLRTGDMCHAGEYGWGGAASTIFWVDPAVQTTLLFFTQLMPDHALPLRSALRQLVGQALQS